jgi:hypothetical protein
MLGDQSGTAVRRIEKLWIVSASRATEPLDEKTKNCGIVVLRRTKRLDF